AMPAATAACRALRNRRRPAASGKSFFLERIESPVREKLTIAGIEYTSMTPPPLRVLLVEDDAAYAGLIEAELRGSSIDLSTVGTLAASRAALAARPFDAVLLDLDLPDSSGVQTVARMHETDATMPVVVLTSNGDEGLSALSMRHGAEDYLLKSEV